MKSEFQIVKTGPATSGVTVEMDSIRIKTVLHGKNSNGILLLPKNDEKVIQIDFDDTFKNGFEYDLLLKGIDVSQYNYMFHEDGVALLDDCAKRYKGHRLFGIEHLNAQEEPVSCVFENHTFDWKNDSRPNEAYESAIYYGAHVRGFTKDASSRIKEAGTFAGMQKKITYLKSLGVTGIVLQPIYDFNECMKIEKSKLSDYTKKTDETEDDNVDYQINYWGYTKAHYYAPKNAYAFSNDAISELKEMIRQFHKNNMEVILQFYFVNSMNSRMIEEVLEYWAYYYHVDGFQIMGAQVDTDTIAKNSYLQNLKIWSDGFDYDRIYKHSIPDRKRLATFDYEFMYAIRKFLKGDENSLRDFVNQSRMNSENRGFLHFVAFHEGFRLADMVSYDYKRNELNGENNLDGNNFNCSWNCGIEGITKKKTVLQLRLKQMKNAMMMLLLAQGTPMIFMGDECCRSSFGNNNPYCQDNELSWMKWNLKKQEKEMLAFVKKMIQFRKMHSMFQMNKPFRNMDYKSCGYPDLSYHGKEAWKPDFNASGRSIGMMYFGKYATTGQEEDTMFVLYNMHWEPKEFAFPKLPKGYGFRLYETSSEEEMKQESDQMALLDARTIAIYLAEKIKEK